MFDASVVVFLYNIVVKRYLYGVCIYGYYICPLYYHDHHHLCTRYSCGTPVNVCFASMTAGIIRLCMVTTSYISLTAMPIVILTHVETPCMLIGTGVLYPSPGIHKYTSIPFTQH